VDLTGEFAADVGQVTRIRSATGPASRAGTGGAMQFYYHPVSSYSQKALVALHEVGASYTPQNLVSARAG